MGDVHAWYLYMHNECVYAPKKRVCANLSRIGQKYEAGII